MIPLLNAFSLNMITLGDHIQTRKLSLEQIRHLAQSGALQSCIGHADTAVVLSGLLGVTIPANRVSLNLEEGDLAIVAQYRGPRLPEGSTTLPAGAVIEFALILIGETGKFQFPELPEV